MWTLVTNLLCVHSTSFIGGIHSTVVARCHFNIDRSSDQSCTRGMIHNKIHRISPVCPWPSITLKVKNCGLKHDSFHFTLLALIFLCARTFRFMVIARWWAHKNVKVNWMWNFITALSRNDILLLQIVVNLLQCLLNHLEGKKDIAKVSDVDVCYASLYDLKFFGSFTWYEI